MRSGGYESKSEGARECACELMCMRERERTRARARRERERERERFIDNQIDDWRSVSTTPLQGDTSWPSIGGEYNYPLSVQPCGTRSATHKRDQTVAGPPQSPTRSLEGSGSQTDPQLPWYNGRAGEGRLCRKPGRLATDVPEMFFHVQHVVVCICRCWLDLRAVQITYTYIHTYINHFIK